MPIIDVLGVPHAYELTAPTRKPITLVFIHGWLLSRGYWQPLIERLSQTYQCLSYDLRGFGDSNFKSTPQLKVEGELSVASGSGGNSPATRYNTSAETFAWQEQFVDSSALSYPPSLTEVFLSSLLNASSNSVGSKSQGLALSTKLSGYTPAAYARDAAVLIHKLGLQQVWLIGHSLGGSIALWGTDQMPQQVKGTICINAGGGIYLKEEFERFRSAGRQLLKMRPRWLCDLPLIDLLFTRASVAKAIDRYWGRQRVIDFVMAHPKAALGTLLESTTEAEVHCLPQIVARLQQPVYFFAGDQDPIMEPKYVRHLASFHPSFGQCGDNVVEIPECGHMAMVEQPDFVADQIQSILAQHQVD
jgi:2-succinyl-6-hydroxy-2,4-cyclohexadiene-1-carboxylate synthase